MLVWLAVLGAGCAAGGDSTEQVSCAELEEQSEVELVLCDDGENPVDRRDELAPATPEAERID